MLLYFKFLAAVFQERYLKEKLRYAVNKIKELVTLYDLSVLQLVFHTFCNDLSAEGTYSSKEEAAARELYFKIMRNSCEIERSFSTPFDDNKKTTKH